MTGPAKQLLGLLVEERDAARRADLLRLETLQEEKRVALAGLRTAAVTDDEREHLARLAQDNVSLLRHLTQVLRGVLHGAAGATYSATGESAATDAIKHERGYL